MMNLFSPRVWIIACIFAVFTLPAQAQRKGKKATTSTYSEKLYSTLDWRCIGPFRGGRSAAVTGVPGKPMLFYFGATGGGVWKTQDGGSTWKNISDGFFGGSIGAVAVSEHNNNIIYVGGGEVTVRGNVSSGSGMWKSQDAGQTWENTGLKNSRHIPRIRIHPTNPNLVYAAVLGDLYKSSEERGVYRSKDGGKTWERILFANKDAGAVDLVMDPNNPRVLYASTWKIRRTPYSLSSGGEGSELWKSRDGGDTWEKLSDKKGFPKGTLGIIGVTVSPVNSQRVWAIAEAKEGGVYRSNNGGQAWEKVNDTRDLRQRAWYYTRIYADTKDENTVYVLNVSYHKSTDGGRTFKAYRSPHGDHHDLWIAPEDPNRMVIGDDGGAQVTYNGGQNWSTYMNQPTAQIYRVTTDNHFPYRIYGAQQDNSTFRINHRSTGSHISEEDWESSAGGESAHLAIDPTNNDIVYGGSYGGFLTRYDHSTKQRRAINVWPDNPMGHGAEGMKYRFQWNFPVFFSPHNPMKLYTTSNHLHVTTNEGESWEVISPDLTRNDSTKLKTSGGPITKDNTGVEYYSTIFAAVESPYEKDLIWTGSDDGLVHVTKDGGKTWDNVTPSGMPEWMMINSIDPDPFTKGGAYIAGTRYKLGDYQPYLYRTKDYGKTWTKITNGIGREDFTRVVRTDPNRQGLLYCGTENGMYISFDDGANWNSFQRNMPIVPITDLTVKNGNLIAATQGRSLWMIDDLSVLHQLNNDVASSDFHLYQPMPAYRMDGRHGRPSTTAGENHPGGVMIQYYLKNKPDSSDVVSIEISDSKGNSIRKFSNKSKKKGEKLEPKDSTNLFVWNMRYEDAKRFDGMILWWGSTSGPKAVPGNYTVKLKVNNDSLETTFTIKADPRAEGNQEDLQAQFDFLLEIRDQLTEIHQTIKNIREVRSQIKSVTKKAGKDKELKIVVTEGKRIDSLITVIEKELYQTQNKSGQDPLNFPIRLNNKLAHVASLANVGYNRPTVQMFAFKAEITTEIKVHLNQWKSIVEKELPAYNQLVRDKKVDAVKLSEYD
jgi:photosystem II stability/assembly factor-like uncharacterized protein